MTPACGHSALVALNLGLNVCLQRASLLLANTKTWAFLVEAKLNFDAAASGRTE